MNSAIKPSFNNIILPQLRFYNLQRDDSQRHYLTLICTALKRNLKNIDIDELSYKLNQC